MSSPLYELTASYARLLEAAEQGADVEALLAELEDSIEAKGAGIARILANLERDSESFGVEEKRLASRRKTTDANIDRLKAYIRECMASAGIRQIKAGTFSITLSPGQDRVEVVNLDLVPAEYVRTKTTREADKRAILDAYKRDGVCVPGVEFVPTTTLRVR